ncbi:methyltransferase, partial [Nonomuraea sp. NPDC055795]
AALAPSPGVILDLCCGSGAMGAALAVLTGGELHAADVDPAAVACARRNLGENVYLGDLFDPLPPRLRGRVDVLLANVPYVPTADLALLPTEARDHEPRVTLDGGPDGLDVLRRVTEGAPRWLAPGGLLLFETSERQAGQAVDAVTASGLKARVLRSEEFHATVVTGLLP